MSLETWLNNSTLSLVPLYNYNGHHSIRSDGRRGGGVSIYTTSEICTKELNNLNISLDFIECIFVECRYGNKKFLVGNVYRPPNSNVDLFIDKIEHLLILISKLNYDESFITGDFNLDLLNYLNDNRCLNFMNVMFSNSMTPIITKPTRITQNSSTLIDNIFIVHPESFLAGCLTMTLSDHYGIFIVKKNFCLMSNVRNLKLLFIEIRVKRLLITYIQLFKLMTLLILLTVLMSMRQCCC